MITLLVIIPLLRMPSLQGGLFPPEESYYLTLVQRMADGHPLYAEAWHAGPPLLVWVHYFFYVVFGNYAFLALRILTCLYIWVSAVFFNGLIAHYKPFDRFPGLPALVLSFLLCVPWYSQELSTSMAIILPSLFALQAILETGERKRRNLRLMFLAGIFMGIVIMIAYKGILIALGLAITYLIIRRGSLDELISFLGGILMFVFFVFLMLFIGGNLDDFWDVGVLYFLDRARLPLGGRYDYYAMTHLQSWLITAGLFMFFALAGWIHYRLRYYSYVAKIRTLEASMAVWLLAAVVLIGIKWNQIQLDDFILLSVPATFYICKSLEFKLIYRLRIFIFILLFGFPLFQYRYYISHEIEELAEDAPSSFWTGKNWQRLSNSLPIKEYLEENPIEGGIWIMDYQPSLYAWLGHSCAVKYTDYRVSAYKIPLLTPSESPRLLARKESDRAVFLQFLDSPPALILDPQKQFSLFQERYPAIGRQYEAVSLETYPIYRRKNIPLSHEIRSNNISRQQLR